MQIYTRAKTASAKREINARYTYVYVYVYVCASR